MGTTTIERTAPTDSLPDARYGRPGLFYFLATAIPWALWFAASWMSRQGAGWDLPVTVLALAGLLAPLGVVAWMARGEPSLGRDMLQRLVNVRDVRPVFWLLAVGLMPASILVATAISIPLGYSADQFLLREGGPTFAVGLVSGWVALTLAPVVEELAWHSYGTDSLRTRFSVFTTSMIFIVIWALWHLPLAFIAGSSQAQTADEGWLHALNFPLSMIPFVLLMNWVYYRSGRNIIVTILFHLGANLVTQILATDPDTEIISTGVLLVVTGVVLWKERALFFTPVRRSAVAQRLSGPSVPVT